MKIGTRAPLRILLLCSITLACTQEGAQPLRSYDTPLRSDTELRTELAALCRASMTPVKRAVLVEFSAAWCSDCQRLSEMKQADALARELAEWPHLTVNVGRFDHHRDTLDRMGIESIAHWAILDPVDCEEPIAQWGRIADRTLEVSSGEARNLTPSDLADWLAVFRKANPRSPRTGV